MRQMFRWREFDWTGAGDSDGFGPGGIFQDSMKPGPPLIKKYLNQTLVHLKHITRFDFPVAD